jgi:hypothetical protein
MQVQEFAAAIFTPAAEAERPSVSGRRPQCKGVLVRAYARCRPRRAGRQRVLLHAHPATPGPWDVIAAPPTCCCCRRDIRCQTRSGCIRCAGPYELEFRESKLLKPHTTVHITRKVCCTQKIRVIGSFDIPCNVGVIECRAGYIAVSSRLSQRYHIHWCLHQRSCASAPAGAPPNASRPAKNNFLLGSVHVVSQRSRVQFAGQRYSNVQRKRADNAPFARRMP